MSDWSEWDDETVAEAISTVNKLNHGEDSESTAQVHNVTHCRSAVTLNPDIAVRSQPDTENPADTETSDDEPLSKYAAKQVHTQYVMQGQDWQQYSLDNEKDSLSSSSGSESTAQVYNVTRCESTVSSNPVSVMGTPIIGCTPDQQSDSQDVPVHNEPDTENPTETETSDDEPLSKYAVKNVYTQRVSQGQGWQQYPHDKDYDSLSSSSDDVPLNILKNTNRQLFVLDDTGSSDYSDSNDPDYMPSSDEGISDRSGNGMEDNSNVKHVDCSTQDADSDLHKACKISRHENTLFNVAVKWHTKRLNNLLSQRQVKILPVSRNGDCFFSAVCKSLTEKNLSVKPLRNLTADHLLENEDHYKHFLSDIKETSYSTSVSKIRNLGHWSDAVNDLLPLVMANLFNLHTTILTSRQVKRVLEIKPSMESVGGVYPIYLVYSAIPGREHYDACTYDEASSSINQPGTGHSTAKNERHLSSSVQLYTPPKRQNSKTDTPKKSIMLPNARKSSSATPRKSAVYKSPKSAKVSRKRVAAPDTWKKSVRKMNRVHGKSYISLKGKIVQAKTIRPRDCSKCFYKCSSHITESEQNEIFQSFWQLGSYERQSDFIINNVEEKETKTKKQRKFSRNFTFLVNGKRIRVCKGFFLGTLNISEKKMRISLQRRRGGNQTQSDRRGRHVPANKTADHRLAGVRKHIESFPTVDSHYARQNTNRKYLSADLSIIKMYVLYKESCSKDVEPVSERVYRNLFNREYNLYFHRPKKDQCELCNKYNQHATLGTCDELLESKYRDHQKRKEAARKEKEVVKKISQDHGDIYAATFDMQAVLPTPCSLVSQVYYKRKLSTYNLSFYSLGDKVGTCYMWNESHGGRGSSEVATCIVKHLQSLPGNIRCATFFSDTCTGQNRNQYVASALHYAVTSVPNLQVVEQKFLEPGHTQMECDSMHSAIEYAKKKTSIYEPSQWDTVVQMARRNNPYIVVPLNFNDFLDFHRYTTTHFQNMMYDMEGKKITWMKIKVLQVRKEEPGKLFLKYSYDEDFTIVNTRRKKQRGRPSTPKGLSINEEPKQKYSVKLPISQKKKQDLLSMCQSGVIPEVYHDFYKRLPSAHSVKDRLPEPDVKEDDDE